MASGSIGPPQGGPIKKALTGRDEGARSAVQDGRDGDVGLHPKALKPSNLQARSTRTPSIPSMASRSSS